VLAVVAAVAAVWALTSPRGTTASDAAATANGSPTVSAPDISNLTPREQFGRLADRIETAMAAGDTATVVRFFPMAEAAFANLTDSTRDNDARFHMSLLRVRVGHFPAAIAEVDSIAAKAPKHLFVSYLRAIIGDLKNDSASATMARRTFRDNFAAEMALNRPEYQMHREMLDQFLATIPAGGLPQ
jgi:hypothetical protein